MSQEELQEEQNQELEQEEQLPQQQLEESQPEQHDEPEIVVSIGEEESEFKGPAPDWVKSLRQKNKEDQRRIRELEAKLQQFTPQEQPLGNKPKLEDFDYDTDKFESALETWHDKKRSYYQKLAKQQEEQEAQVMRWQEKLVQYQRGKSELKVKDFDDSQSIIESMMSTAQQGLIVERAQNPALVVYALGKNPKKAQELAAINDPIDFVRAIDKLEGNELKVTNKRTAPPPEKLPSGASGAPVSNGRLDELKQEAERTGDYSKYLEYKRSIKK